MYVSSNNIDNVHSLLVTDIHKVEGKPLVANNV